MARNKPVVIRELGGGWRIEEWFVPIMREGEEGEYPPTAHSFHRSKGAAIKCAKRHINGKIVWGSAKVGPVHMLVHETKPLEGVPMLQCKPFKEGDSKTYVEFEGVLRPCWDDYKLEDAC